MHDNKNLRRLLVAGAATVALALVPAAGATGKYADPSGDSGTAPDITAATVASDKGGNIVLRVEAAAAVDGDNWIGVPIDTDLNPLTGNIMLLGAEYLFEVDSGGYGFAHWTGSSWDWDTPYTTVHVFTSASTATFIVNKSELGNTDAFNFWVHAGDGDGAAYDDAPNDGTFNYSLVAGGVAIQSVDVRTTPQSGPKAGKPFTVAATGLHVPNSSNPVAPESYSCTAKLAGKTLRGTGAGGCTFRLAKSARGKRLAVTVTVVYQGTSKATSLTFKVR
jgi:hypothetical protein